MKHSVSWDPIKSTGKKLTYALQIALVASSSLLVFPILTGMDPSITFLTAGIGTLIFHAVTKGQVPVFLGSSFSFIPAIALSLKLFGPSATAGAIVFSGSAHLIISAFAKAVGPGVVRRAFPPLVVGPVIVCIGLSIAPAAFRFISGDHSDGMPARGWHVNVFLAAIAFGTTVLSATYLRGYWAQIPVLIGVATGCGAALCLGVYHFEEVSSASAFVLPSFTVPSFDWRAIVLVVPVSIAPALEHLGDVQAISEIVGKDFYYKPGIHRTLIGDALASGFAGLLGGPPNTTYSHVSGTLRLTGIHNPSVVRWAAVVWILLAFSGHLQTLVQTIPKPVLGGTIIVLLGMIVWIGIDLLFRSGLERNNKRQIIVASSTLVIGVGGSAFMIGEFRLPAIGMAALSGIVLNMLLRPTTRR
jgi:uracil permease